MAPRRDFRKLDPTTQAELRRVAVAMVEAGKTRVEAAAAVGVNRRFVGEWVDAVTAVRRGRPGRWAAWPPAGRAEGPLGPAGAEDQTLDRGPVPGSAEAALRALDPRSGARADRARGRGAPVGFGHRAHPARLGVHSTAPGAAGDRAARTGSRRLAATRVSGDCRAREGGGRRDPLGRRDRPVEPGQLRPQLRAARRDARADAASSAGLAVDDLQPDQPRHAALHGLRRRARCGDLPRLPAPAGERRPRASCSSSSTTCGSTAPSGSPPGPRPMPSGSNSSTSRPTRPSTIPTSSSTTTSSRPWRAVGFPGTRPR